MRTVYDMLINRNVIATRHSRLAQIWRRHNSWINRQLLLAASSLCVRASGASLKRRQQLNCSYARQAVGLIVCLCMLCVCVRRNYYLLKFVRIHVYFRILGYIYYAQLHILCPVIAWMTGILIISTAVEARNALLNLICLLCSARRATIIIWSARARCFGTTSSISEIRRIALTLEFCPHARWSIDISSSTT